MKGAHSALSTQHSALVRPPSPVDRMYIGGLGQ